MLFYDLSTKEVFDGVLDIEGSVFAEKQGSFLLVHLLTQGRFIVLKNLPDLVHSFMLALQKIRLSSVKSK